MASSIVQSAATQAAVTAPTVTLGAAPTVGNTLVAVVSSDTTHTAPNAGAGKTFTQRVSQVNNQGFYVWTRLVVSGDSATVTFAASSAGVTSAQVIEVQGTYDKTGAGTTVINSVGGTRDATGLTPATADNTVLACYGIHGFNGANPSGGSVDNAFTVTQTSWPATASLAQAGTIVAQKFTAATAATGTTTATWTGNALDRDGVQIAFTGVAGGAAAPNPRPTTVYRTAVHRSSNY